MPRYTGALGSTLHGATVPYGYTLTIWCSGQFLSDLRGQPRLLLVMGFVAGAALAFALLRWLAPQPEGSLGNAHALTAALLQIGAIAAAVAAVAAVAQIPTGLDWPLAGFVSTAVYLGGTAASMALRYESG
jgi:hypothetical protein